MSADMDRGDYDLVVLGAGNAGLAAARVVREAGKSVLIAEARDVGGTCPLRGCVPKKVLVAAAETLDVIARAPEQGIHPGEVSVSWERVIERKGEILAGTSEGLEADLAKQGIELVKGRARFVASDAVVIGERRVTAKQVLVATGSAPRRLGIAGEEHLTTSDELLSLTAAPRSMVFIGAGVIAFELGHVFARLGTQVTLLEVAPRPLGPFDEEAVEHLVAATRALGVDVQTGVAIQAIEPHQGRFEVRYEHGGVQRSLVVERVAHGAGRVADTADLGLAAANVREERGAIVTAAASGEPFRSASNERVFVAGDALRGTPQLSPVATAEGRLAGRAMLGERVQLDYLSIPSCVFSIPTLATVGHTERAAREAGKTIAIHRNDMTGWRSGRSYVERHAWAKVLVDETDHIAGAHLLGHGAAETIHVFALAMKHGIKTADLKSFVWAYPTFTSDVQYLV